jgi:hypothetical protein
MKIGLALLCIGAVAFLLRFLTALMKEAGSLPAPSRRRGKLLEMKAEVERRQVPPRTAQRIAR